MTTEAVVNDARRAGEVPRFQLQIVEGPDAGKTWESEADVCSIGSHPSNDLVIDEPTVSRFHCEVRIASGGATVRDLDSRNGTNVDGVDVIECRPRSGSLLRLGRTTLRFDFAAASNRLPMTEATSFGSLVGTSIAMRTSFALLERAAATDVTVLLEGETGTGKEGAAESIHREGRRAEAPFVVVDCGAIPASLLESELFGHEKGAFTGAATRRVGAFEEADGGTIFLDEIGELPLEMQPKLLRVLEKKQIRRIGGNAYEPVDVRVVAATHRDLRSEVNEGRFRSDLYYRLAVVRVPLPPLRSRPDDIPMLVDRILTTLGAGAEARSALVTDELLATLQTGAWPGNVRELRNYLERCLVFEELLPLSEVDVQEPRDAPIDVSLSYETARSRGIAEWERRYLQALMRAHDGKPSEAARAVGIDRVYLWRLMRKHGIKKQ